MNRGAKLIYSLKTNMRSIERYSARFTSGKWLNTYDVSLNQYEVIVRRCKLHLNLVSKTKWKQIITWYIISVCVTYNWFGHIWVWDIYSLWTTPYHGRNASRFLRLEAWSLISYPAVQWLITSSALPGTSTVVMTSPLWCISASSETQAIRLNSASLFFQVTRSSAKFDYSSYHEIRLR